MARAELTLPGGLWRDGARRRRARLSWPDEDGERTLLEAGEDLLPAARVTALIAACVTVDGEPPGEAAAAAAARELLAGDRVALVLALRRLASCDALPCVLPCPYEDCGEQLELELAVSELLLDGPELDMPPIREIRVGGARVRFRLPAGADEERAARRALENPEAAAAELLEACLVEAPEPRPAGLAAAVAEAMAASDPQADISLALTCPACGRPGEVSLDPGAYFFAELAARVARLEREVHVLASRYGWSERDIVGLGRVRRARYLELVSSEAGAQ
jgi:hypothetical protein